jgi:hypothetical protein
MSNYFVKFFDAIQDRVARHELEEEIKLDKLFGKNKLSGKTTFEGIVMNDPAGTAPETTNGSTVNRFVAVKVYIKDIDDHIFDFDILKNTTDEQQKINLLNNLIGGCYTAYPDTALYSSEPDPKFQAGCTVELKFADQGPQTADHGRMRGLRYTKVTRRSDDRYSQFAKYFTGQVSNLFENQSVSQIGDIDTRSSRDISDLSPQAQTIINEFMNEYKNRTGIELRPTSTLRTYGAQVRIEHDNVQRAGGQEWYRKTYGTNKTRTEMLNNYISYPNDRDGNIQRNVPILKASGLGSSHLKGLGIDFSTNKLTYDQGVKLEELALEYKNSGKFANFEWELVSTKYSSNREARKTKGTTFPNEHFHISIKADARGQF